MWLQSQKKPYRNSCHNALSSNALKQSHGILAGFEMEGKDIRTGLNKTVCISFRLFNHQMNVEDQISLIPQGLYYGESEGNICNEHSVHYVKMHHIGSATLNLLYLICKVGKVAGENGRGNFSHIITFLGCHFVVNFHFYCT